MRGRFQIGFLAVVSLVLLRVALGWHFLYEGWWKWKHPRWSAEGFFRQARGPLAPYFHRLVPDYDGRKRLDKAWVFQRWQQRVEDAAAHFGFDQQQRTQAQQVLKTFEKQLEDFFADHESEIREYLSGLRQWYEQARQAASQEVPYLQERLHRRWQELQSQGQPLLEHMDRLLELFDQQLEQLATPEQLQRRGPLPPVVEWIDWIDWGTRWALMGIGLGLMLGLLTRLAALAGAVFLLLVVLAQPALPGQYPPPHPSQGHALLVNKDVIEMLAMWVMVFAPVGRWAGLDFVLYHGCCRRCRKQTSDSDQIEAQ